MLQRTMNPTARTLCAATLAVLTIGSADTALAGRKTRLFTFENGSPGATTSTALNTITGPFKDVPDSVFGAPFDYYDVGPGGIPGGSLLGDWVAANYDPSPDFTAQLGGQPTYVNVANGSPLDSPVPGSNVALGFSGANQAMTSQGFRGTFIADAAVASNAPSDSNNTSTSFTVLSQAWVRPDAAAAGTSQVVWSVGTEMGGVRITPAGVWELTSMGPPGDVTSSRPVSFGDWTHVAVLRTGGAGSLYINGTIAAQANGFFNAFANEIVLGADPFFAEPFRGVVDNFSTVGTAGFGITISTDLDVFSDLGLPQPSGVAGDVDQDGDADQADYNIWSTNVGFNNTFGQGDLTTLIKGDLDQNGKIDFFDFRIIARQAAGAGVTLSLAVPEPAGALVIALGLAALVMRRR
ncbi:MAG: hypothetical protein DCC67_04385 [Planctomycetota bacterium]|nr:MAG: hypothetical protein DCC67_04385 [Planctomycetota bacterium]